MSIDRRKDKDGVHVMKYYSAVKQNEIVPLVTTQMGLEIITLSEVSQKETNTMWYHLYVESKI